MKENLDSQEAHLQGLKEAKDFIDAMDGVSDEEREKLKDNVAHPGIQERVLEIKYMLEETDADAKHRASILLEALKSDIKDF
jgi:ribosomal protein L7/L12